jgi:hypothetical protein
VEEETDQLWERLELWQKNTDVGMTKDRYIEMEEQLGREPDPKKCPPGIEDFPECVHDALNIFNSLGDRVYPEIGYMGKDYTNLKMLLNLYEVENIELVYSILLRLDSQAIKKSQDSLKREYDKIKSKNRG